MRAERWIEKDDFIVVDLLRGLEAGISLAPAHT
jgi:hypothetical protein